MTKRFLIAVLCVLWTTAAFAQRDAIDLSTAVVLNSPSDVASWPITTKITTLTMHPASAAEPGLEFHFPARATWPDWTPPGFEGPLQYTVWAGVRINGVWHVAGFIRMWRARVATGAPILTNNNFAINWAYDARWGAMAGYQPVAGEAMIFFVTAGVARGFTTVTSVRERSNVVMVNLPANDTGVFTFPDQLTDLVIDRGSQGLWTLTDSTTLVQTHPFDPELVVTGDFDGSNVDEIAVDFGPAWGVWIRWNGGGWSQLHGISPTVMTAGDVDGNGRDELVLAFADHGLWALVNGTTWAALHALTPVRMLMADIDGGGADLVLDFPGLGVWVRLHSGAWRQVHPQSPTRIVAGNFDGLGRDDLAMIFPGVGAWIWLNATSWVQVQAPQPVDLAAGNLDADARAELVMDFGGLGIWILRNMSGWTQLHALASRHIVLADLDGNLRTDVVVDFGAPFGVWVWANDSNWVPVTATSFEQIVVGQLN